MDLEERIKDLEIRLRELEKAAVVDKTQLSLLISQVSEFRTDMKAAFKELVDHYDAKLEKFITKESGGWWLNFGQDIVKYIVMAVVGGLLALIFIKR